MGWIVVLSRTGSPSRLPSGSDQRATCPRELTADEAARIRDPVLLPKRDPSTASGPHTGFPVSVSTTHTSCVVFPKASHRPSRLNCAPSWPPGSIPMLRSAGGRGE